VRSAVKAELPVGIELEQVQDQPQAVSRSVGEFVRVLVEAVVIVLAVSFISLGLHFKPLRLDIWPGLVVAITIPLVLAITFVTMFYWGIGLHKISLGSLIIALGLLVDDAIIAVEMMVRKLEEGHDKRYAATFAYDVTAMPMLTGTLITAAGFLPIGLASRHRGVHLRDLCRHHGGAADLVGGLGVLRALPGRPVAAHATARCKDRCTSCSTPPSIRLSAAW
jgi:multidrug efflux pump